MNEYFWPDGKLKWLDGSIKEWDCKCVTKCDVLVNAPDGMYTYNTDYPEPELPYTYVYLDELFSFCGLNVKERGPMPDCNCVKINK